MFLSAPCGDLEMLCKQFSFATRQADPLPVSSAATELYSEHDHLFFLWLGKMSLLGGTDVSLFQNLNAGFQSLLFHLLIVCDP